MIPKKILFAIDNLSGGGAEKVVLTLSTALIDMGHKPFLLTLGTEQDYSLPKGLSVLQVPPPTGTFRNLAQYIRHATSIDNRITSTWPDIQFDLIVSNLYRTDRTLYHSKRLTNVWNCLHKPLSYAFLSQRQGLKHWWKHHQVHQVYQGKRWIGVSSGILEDLQSSFGSTATQSVVIHNPFDIDQIQALSQAPNPLARIDYCIHVGRFHQEKRHDRLLRAYKASGINSKLVLLGQGNIAPIQDMIAKLGLSEQIILPGFTTNPYPLIAGAKALILSSDYEGFGNVLVESLICGTPAISVDCPTGPREILTEELSQWLIPMNDIDALSSSIQRVIANPPIITPKHYKRFCSHKIANSYLELCR